MSGLVIGVDFDGTLAQWDNYPNIGAEVPHAVRTLLDLQKLGHRIILWTVRSEDGLSLAQEWCKNRGIELWACNDRIDQRCYSSSPKIDADIYIDDKAIGCPLLQKDGRAYVNWIVVRLLLEMRGILK